MTPAYGDYAAAQIGRQYSQDEIKGGLPASVGNSAQVRFHAIVESMEAEFEASWQSLNTIERQHALTALTQAKQFEVLLSAHVVKAEDALDHKHNSLVAATAQAVLTNSLKVDENAFKRTQRKTYYREIKAAMEEYKAKQAAQRPSDSASS
jgi:hemerythrin-like domain-containing protein